MQARRVILLGGARSGKSHLAQRMAERLEGPLTFLATADGLDEEMEARISRHRADRGPRWSTVECPIHLPDAVLGVRDGVVLVDCLTLWLSNLMLAGLDVAEATGRLLDSLSATPLPVIIVSNEVGMGIVPDHPLGREFRDEAGRLNQSVASAVDDACLVVAGLLLVLRKPL